jgi:polyketide cyclase/dehydrase/lipid transport protein
MTFIKRFLGLVFLVVAALVVGAYLLPKEVTVERSIVINAAPDKIFPLVNNQKNSRQWSPWLARDPDVKLVYSGPDAGAGSKMQWTSDNPNVGNGTAVIVASVENESIKTKLDFGSQGTADAWFNFAPEGDATQVSWGFTTDMGMNPIGRWMGLMMDKWVGGDYEQGLANLKALVEE